MQIGLTTFFTPRWRWATVAVILGMLFLARLGFWQLDRLEWRRGLNAEISRELEAAPVSLNGDLDAYDLTTMRNRQVNARGRYDIENQFLIESQVYNGQQGRYLLTPLMLDGRDDAVLVNRGWVPFFEDNVTLYDPDHPAEVFGYIQLTQTLSGDRPTEITADKRVFRIDVAAMDSALPYDLLPIYIAESLDAEFDNEFPYVVEPDLSLDEGSHLSYAFQWFSFSLMLLLIYVYYVNRNDGRPRRKSE